MTCAEERSQGTAQQAMYAVGVVEIVAGLVVAVVPRYGAWLVAAWLVGIIVNLLTLSGFYDVALRDFGVSNSPSTKFCRTRMRPAGQSTSCHRSAISSP